MAMNHSVYNTSKSCYLNYRRSICVNVLKLWFIPHSDFEMELLVDQIQHKKSVKVHDVGMRYTHLFLSKTYVLNIYARSSKHSA